MFCAVTKCAADLITKRVYGRQSIETNALMVSLSHQGHWNMKRELWKTTRASRRTVANRKPIMGYFTITREHSTFHDHTLKVCQKSFEIAKRLTDLRITTSRLNLPAKRTDTIRH